MKERRYSKCGIIIRGLVLGMIFCLGLNAVAGEPPVINLTGVMQSAQGPAAYVDGQLLWIGDEVSGCRITAIDGAGMHLTDEGGNVFFVPIGEAAYEVDAPDVPVAETNEVVQEVAEWGGVTEIIPKETEQESQAEPLQFPEMNFDPKVILALVLFGLGFLIAMIGNIWFLVAAFRESIWWGLGCFFIGGIVSLIFLIMHWEEAKRPLGLSLLGAIIAMTAVFISPEIAAH